jgi:glutathione-regulated potassium-efflux system ancillary protein KefG
MIKEWMDLVLEHGFAYGMKGRALEGKWVFSAISTGGSKEVYSKTGGNRFTINQFLAPYNQSANLCRMKYLPPFVVHGSHTLSEAELQKAAQDYKQLLTGLRDDKFTESTFAKAEYLNTIIEQNA